MLFAPIPTDPEYMVDNPLLHIPDGFLSVGIAIVCWVVTLVVLAIAVNKAQEVFDERLAPLAGVMAAFIFAGQMINFPVASGTSGHLIGATLAVVVLGPWLGLLAMTAVIVLQALLFQDGGLVVMGANVLVMGIVPGLVGYGIYQLTKNLKENLRFAAVGAAAWFSVMMAALITALLLGFSGTTSLGIAIPAMLGVHALIGVGEALITVAALGFIARTRPGLLQTEAKAVTGTNWVVAGLGIALLVVLFAPLASGSPDGLEWVAEQTGFIDTAQDAPYELLPDYTLAFLGETSLSTILAGAIGTILVAGLTYMVTRSMRRSSRSQADAH